MRIRPLMAAALVLALAAAIPSSSSAATKKHSCAAKASKTVAKNRYARVFTKSVTGGNAEIDEIQRLYGCLYSNGKRWRLDTARDDEYVSSESYNAIKLNGRFVAWQHSGYDASCKADCPDGYNESSVELRVANLRRKRIKEVDGSLGEGTALVVTRTGAIAWIQPGSPVAVKAFDAGGARDLYAGDDIDGGSLSLRGSSVRWIAGGNPMSATLR